MEDYTETVGFKGSLLITKELKEEAAFINIKNSIKDLSKASEEFKKIYRFFEEEKENSLFIISTNKEQEITFSKKPLLISKILKEELFSKDKKFYLLGSSLSIDKKFNFLKTLLGLPENFGELILNIAQDSDSKAEIIIPADFPSIYKEDFFYKTNELISKMDKNTLVLSNSYKSIENSYLSLFSEIKNADFIAQGVNGGPAKITATLKQLINKKEKNIILFSNSFLLDILEDDDNCFTNLIITRLPFDPPNDPLVKSRASFFSDPFNDYRIPTAVLKLKNTINKFLAGKAKKKYIIILDKRILTEDYGKTFMQNFPEGVNLVSIRTIDILSRIKH